MSSVPFLEVVRSGSTDYQTSQTEIVLVSHGHTLFRKRRKGLVTFIAAACSIGIHLLALRKHYG